MRRLLPAFPYPHFMAFAPLDVWVRTLLRGGAIVRIGPRYWLRLVWCLFTSLLGTLLTLPERLVWWMVNRCMDRPPPKVLCILGYFRSGTTHLHYILSSDPRLTTPRWYQCLAPQGWAASWAFLRWFLIPFLSSTRPQDDMAIGPEWPAEDDFALCNGHLASSMPGRMVLPGEWTSGGRWAAMHNLDSARDADRTRFRKGVVAFARRVASLPENRGGQWLILKNPSHTGRINELIKAFGAENIRFIHITRDPGAVVRSNTSMHRRFDPFLLQPIPDDQELRTRIIAEYDATERKFLAEASALPPGMLARMRYQDLIADPLGQLKRAYGELNLTWTDELQARFAAYLQTVADYRTAIQQAGKPSDAEPSRDAMVPQLEWMTAAFGHHTPAAARVALPTATSADSPVFSLAPGRTPVGALAFGACVWAALWLGLAWVFNDRMDWFTWPTGVVLGSLPLAVGTREGGRGSVLLGWGAALATLTTFLVIAYPATALSFYRGRTPQPWSDILDSTLDGLLAINNLFWVFLGTVTAYRLASRKHAAAPGR